MIHRPTQPRSASLFRRVLLCSGWYIVATVGLALGQAPVNPPWLNEPLLRDASAAARDTLLNRRLAADPTSLNPLLMYTAVDAAFDHLVWDRPFVLNAALELIPNPNLVEAFTMAADQTWARVTLKRDRFWHDGEPVTAADIAFSHACLTDARIIARRARSGTEQFASVEATDAWTVEYRFREARPTNRWHLNFPIIPRHRYAPLRAEDPTLSQTPACVQANRMPVGNGPYRVAHWHGGESILLERWEAYAGDAPAIATMRFRIIPDPNAAMFAFETGKIDETSLTPRQFARETNSARFEQRGVKASAPQWTVYYMGWNLSGRSSFLADRRVRLALSHALDLATINQRVFYGLFEPCASVLPPAALGGAPGLVPRAYDPAAAARLLDSAGFRRTTVDGPRFRTEPDGARTPARFTLNLIQGSQTSPRVADLYRENLRDLGVEMVTETLAWSVFNERNLEHAFDAYLAAWTAGPEPDDAWSLFHSSAIEGGRNYVGYASAEVDALFEQARGSFAVDTRRSCYAAIARRLYEDLPYTVLVNAPTLWAFQRDLRGVTMSARGPVLFYPGARAWWKPRP